MKPGSATWPNVSSLLKRCGKSSRASAGRALSCRIPTRGASPRSLKTETKWYDPHGNRQTNANGSYQYEPNTLRLQNWNGLGFSYDNNGNVTAAGGATYTYTPHNMMASAIVAGSTAIYAYDGDNWRVKKSTGGSTTFFLRGSRNELLTEWTNPGAGGETARDYIYIGSRLIAAAIR